jgi:phenylalanyl-tRNA synthetase beta chain
MVIPALDRCAALIAQLAGGAIRAGVVDAHPRPHRAPEVRLRWSRPEQLLGQPAPREETRRILLALGFDERRSDGEGATFAVPPWRQDVSREEDLIEEVVRTRGYDGIPETLPNTAASGAEPPDAVTLGRAREALEALGFVETVNFSFVAPREQERFGADPIALANPITADLAVMRTSLVPSLLKVLAHNLRNGAEGARFYELACAYERRGDAERDPPAREGRRLSGVLQGRAVPHGWAVTERAVDTAGKPVELDTTDFYDARAAVESLLDACGMSRATFAPSGAEVPWLHPRSACTVSLGATSVGRLGEIHPGVAEVFELPRGVFAFELDLDALLPAVSPVPQYRGFSRFPFVTRDIAVVVDEAVPAAAVQRIVEEVTSGGLLENSTLYDQFRGAPLPAGKKNLAIYLRLRAPDRTLTDDEADALRARIVERLRADPSVRAELRG